MNHDHDRVEPRDLDHINLEQPKELRWWCAVLGTGEEELRFIVRHYGSDSHAVEVFLNRCNMTGARYGKVHGLVGSPPCPSAHLAVLRSNHLRSQTVAALAAARDCEARIERLFGWSDRLIFFPDVPRRQSTRAPELG